MEGELRFRHFAVSKCLRTANKIPEIRNTTYGVKVRFNELYTNQTIRYIVITCLTSVIILYVSILYLFIAF